MHGGNNTGIGVSGHTSLHILLKTGHETKDKLFSQGKNKTEITSGHTNEPKLK